jgi:hypothetical protein
MDLTIDVQDFSRKIVYEMVETTAYFEAYNPILEGLQQTSDDDLPFQVGTRNSDLRSKASQKSIVKLQTCLHYHCNKVRE